MIESKRPLNMGKPGLTVLIAFASLLIAIGAFAIRGTPTVSESLHWDSVDYVRASREGFLANWIDQGHPGIANFGKMFRLDLPYDKTVIRGGVDVFWLRHFHPPMLAYVLHLQEKLLGFSNFKVRILSMVSGALTCALLVLAVWVLRPTGALAVMSGLLSGIILGASPYHLMVSRTASYHALFPFLLSLFLFALSIGVEKREGSWLLVSFGFLALCMATFEWSILLPFVLAGALFVTRNPWFRWYAGKGLCVSGAFLTASIGSVLLFTILWPAGVIKADFFQGLAYNTLYSSYALNRTAGMGTHWWDIYSWYYRTAPAIAVLQLIALAYFVIRVFVRREYGLWVWLLFGGLFILASLRQRQIHVHYMAPLFPVVSLFAGVLVHDIGKRLPTIVGKFVPIILAIVCILSAFPKWNKPFTDPQEVPGFSQTAAFLQKAGGLESSILATAAPLLKFYMEGYDIRDIPLGLIPLERINEIKHHRYRYVTIYRDQFELVRGFDDDPGYRFIIENLKLRHTIRHLRRGFECMWIYEDTLWKTPDRIRIPPEVFEPLTTRSGIELWHAPMDSLPIRESELIQLYSDGHIMERRSGWPYRDWRLGYYTVDTYNPRVGLVVAAPGDSGAEWIADREFAAAVPHSNEIPFDRDGLEE